MSDVDAAAEPGWDEVLDAKKRVSPQRLYPFEG